MIMLFIKRFSTFFPMSLMGIFSFFILTSSLNAADSTVRQNLIVSSNIDMSGQYTFAQCNAIKEIPFDPEGKKKKALIIGDSQACDFLNGVMENHYLNDYQIRFRYIPYRCQPVLDNNSARFIDPKDRAFCANKARVDSLEEAREQISESNLIVFAARWKPNVAKALPHTLRSLGLKPHQKVFVLGSKNFGKVEIRRYLHMSNEELRTLKNEIGEEPREINNIFRKGLSRRIVFIDQLKLICGTGEECPIFTGRLKLISYDGRHLTKLGARYVGRILFQNSGLSRL